MAVKVTQEIDIYEIDGSDTDSLEKPKMGIDSHWNNEDFVILRIGKKTYTVVGDDLKTAIDNAMNAGG